MAAVLTAVLLQLRQHARLLLAVGLVAVSQAALIRAHRAPLAVHLAQVHALTANRAVALLASRLVAQAAAVQVASVVVNRRQG